MNWESIIDLHAAMLSNAKDVHAKTEQHPDLTAHELHETISAVNPGIQPDTKGDNVYGR